MLYLISGLAVIYLVFSCSFFLIDTLFDLFIDSYVRTDSPWFFSNDFWTILSGSSLYSVAFLASTVFKLVQTNATTSNRTPSEITDTIVLKDGVKTPQRTFIQKRDCSDFKSRKFNTITSKLFLRIVILCFCYMCRHSRIVNNLFKNSHLPLF